jgi:hypothetical protein
MASAIDTERRGAPKHDDVQYAVSSKHDMSELVYDTFDEAAADAVEKAISLGESYLDVLVYSVEGAWFLGDNAAVDQYNEDREASVFERIELKANVVGRVP